MADALTPNFNFTLPEVGASDDTWGGKLNTNWANLDTILKTKLLNNEGGTLTGSLNIFPPAGTNAFINLKAQGAASSYLVLEKGQTGQTVQIQSLMAGKYRWIIDLGNTEAESGADAGSNFGIYRYADGGGGLGMALGINRATGLLSVIAGLNVGGAFTLTGAATFNGTVAFGAAASFAVPITGNVSATGTITASGAITAGGTFQSSTTTCILATGAAGTIYLRPQGYSSSAGQSYLDVNGDFHVTGRILSGGYSYGDGFISNNTTVYLCTSAAGTVYLRPNGISSSAGQLTLNSVGDITTTGEINLTPIGGSSGSGIHAGRGLQTKNGSTATGYGGSRGNFYWSAGVAYVFIDDTAYNVNAPCDYRLKQDVKPIRSTWDKVKALRPISYKWRDHDVIKADGVERWGFIAHELQEALIPSAAHEKKDGKIMQTPDPMAIIAALTAALQEAQVRIEALEAKLAA